jgi:hypothetical protein
MNDDNRSNILFFGNKSNTNNIILNNINPNNNRNIPSETSFKNNSSPVNVMMSGRSVLYPPGFPPPSSSSDPRVLQSQQFHSVPHAVPGSSGPSIPVSHAALYGQHIPAQVSLPSGVPYLFREGHFPVSIFTCLCRMHHTNILCNSHDFFGFRLIRGKNPSTWTDSEDLP